MPGVSKGGKGSFMRFVRMLVTAGLFAAASSAALADEVKMTGDEIRQALIGNKVQYTTQWGYAEAYRDPNGTFYIRNSKGERGRGTWSIEGDEFCIKWTEKYRDWRTADTCTPLIRVDATTVRTNKGTDWEISQGDPTKVKLD